MVKITLKDVPDDLHAQLQRAAAANFRSLGKEAMTRVQRMFDLEDRLSAPVVDRLIQEAIDSGPEETLTRQHFDVARRKARLKFEGDHVGA